MESRQRKYQKKHKELGLCQQCGKRAGKTKWNTTHSHCTAHRIQILLKNKIRYHLKKQKEYETELKELES